MPPTRRWLRSDGPLPPSDDTTLQTARTPRPPVELVLKRRTTIDCAVAPLPLRPPPVHVGRTFQNGFDALCAFLIVALFVVGGIVILFAWGVVFTGVHTASQDGRLQVADDVWRFWAW